MNFKNNFGNKGMVKVVNGSVICPENSGLRLILSIANMAGKVETPLISLFDKRWKNMRTEIKGWYADRNRNYKLGAINTKAVQSDIWVVSMLCQDENLKTDSKGLETCMKNVLGLAKYEKASVHVSSALLGVVPELENMAKKFADEGVSVYFYNEPDESTR